ncbi:MAG TPA: hypothetical protein VNS58_29200 [Puia sp.]|nr:hypothetical protein [Puia sp.]
MHKSVIGNTPYSLKEVINTQKDSLPALRRYIDLLGLSNDTVTTQFNVWMKQFPGSAAIPFAIGQSYYNDESPRATPYLLRVVELQPGNTTHQDMA